MLIRKGFLYRLRFKPSIDTSKLRHQMPVNAYAERSPELASAQRKLARMTKRSSNWAKLKRKIRNIHIQIADKRLDDLQKITTDLSKNHALVVLRNIRARNALPAAMFPRRIVRPRNCSTANGAAIRRMPTRMPQRSCCQGWGTPGSPVN